MSFASLSSDFLLKNQTKSNDFVESLVSEAATRDGTEVIEFLVKIGIDINLNDRLNCAIVNNDVQLVEFLLKSGARFESLMREEGPVARYVFMKTKFENRKKIFELLFQHGLDAQVKSKNGYSILHEFLYQVNKYDQQDVVKIVEILLDVGISVNEFDYNGFTPLRISLYLYHKSSRLISFLIKKGANVNEKHRGLGLLSLAARLGHLDIVDLLFSNGAEIDAKDKKGWTSLHHACFKNYKEVISFLLRSGADISAENKNGQTPFFLLVADQENYEQCIRVMVKEFSRLSFESIPVSKKDMDLVHKNQKAREHFSNCKSELEQMAKYKFYARYSYYCVLKMSKNLKKLANLTVNEEFKSHFEESLHKFSYYKADLQRIYEKAIKIRNELEAINLRLKTIFKDFLPDIVIRKLAINLNIDDLPLH